MEPNFNPDRLVAQTLAAPFTPRSQGNPLSFKPLHDGGMVVISADGRKLWFSAAEVQAARRQLREQAKNNGAAARTLQARVPIKLVGAVSEPLPPPWAKNSAKKRKRPA